MKTLGAGLLFIGLWGIVDIPKARAQQKSNAPQASAKPTAPVTTPSSAKPVTSEKSVAPAAKTMPGVSNDSPVESILSEDLIRALRDPFQLPSVLLTHKENPKTDLELFPIKDFKLNGVVTGPKKTRAMISAPNNKVFFVKPGDKIGTRDGTISQILPDSIKIIEYFVDEHGKRQPDIYELKVSGEIVSLNKREDL